MLGASEAELDSGREADGKLELRDKKFADSDSGVGVVRLRLLVSLCRENGKTGLTHHDTSLARCGSLQPHWQ
jgi:hypothetical protein